jgi:hypothetical protein
MEVAAVGNSRLRARCFTSLAAAPRMPHMEPWSCPEPLPRASWQRCGRLTSTAVLVQTHESCGDEIEPKRNKSALHIGCSFKSMAASPQLPHTDA